MKHAGRVAGLFMIMMIVAGPSGLAGGFGGDEAVVNTSLLASWHRDKTGDGVDDRLEEAIDEGARGDVIVELRYERRPTDGDVGLLRSQFHVVDAYRYNNWDEILVRVDYDHVMGLIEAPGVVAVEWIPPASLDLDVSTSAIRASESPIVADGFNHSQAVHETYGLRGEGMVIAVMDTGVDNRHVSLQDKLVSKADPVEGDLRLGGADVTTGLGLIGCIDPTDEHGHGTHVAGTALGRGGGATQPGVAPEARLVEIKISTIGFTGFNAMSIGIDWLLDFNAGTSCFGDPGEDRVDVLSISFSLGSNNPADSLNRKFTDVVRSGITVVFSAGNAGPGTESVTKGVEGAILVANSNDRNSIARGDDDLTCSSSRGPRPSDSLSVRDLMPHVAAPGTSIAAPRANSFALSASYTGTSMSAPHVSGLAALVLQANETLRPVDQPDWRMMGDPGAVPVRDVLIQSADYRDEVRPGCPAPQMTLYGMFERPWNNAWGHGLVDGHEAVRVALGGEPAPPSEIPEPGEPFVYEAFPVDPVPRDTTGWETINAGDDTVHSIAIPQTRFFGQTYTTLNVSSNGFVSFSSTHSGCCTGQSIPTQDSINGIVAGAWTDLDPSRCGQVRYITGLESTTLSFEEVCYYASSSQTATFWIEIHTSGLVELHLLDADGGSTMTTGIEGPQGLWGIELRRTDLGLDAPLAWQMIPEDVGGFDYVESSIAPSGVDITDWPVLPIRTDEVLPVDISPTRFYDLNVTKMHVSSNGFVSFAPEGTGDGCCAGGEIPAEDGVDGIVAALWTDLDPKRCGTVAYNLSEGVKVAFIGVPFYGSHCDEGGQTATFWLWVTPQGDIEIHLLEIAGGQVGTTGVESPDAALGNQTRKSSDPVLAPLAWRYTLVENETDQDPDPGDPPEPPEPPEGYQENFTWNGHLACAVKAGFGVNACGVTTLDDFLHPFSLDEDVRSIVIGMEWEPGTLMVDDRLLLLVERSTGSEYARQEGTSPIEVRVDDPSSGFGQFRVFPGGEVNVVVEQPFTVHYHVFYHQPAPERYSALPAEDGDGS